jgi:pimeloyl-ACP methyl ester carboxylesterase
MTDPAHSPGLDPLCFREIPRDDRVGNHWIADAPCREGWVQGDVNANRIKVHYYRTGGDKPRFVLSHGFSDNGMCWIRAAKALEDAYDLIMPDARGHGLSSAPEGGYDDTTRAADLARFVMALGLAKPAAMGHSMGAATTAVAAANYPELFSCIVLEDPPWFSAEPPHDAGQAGDRGAGGGATRGESNCYLSASRA